MQGASPGFDWKYLNDAWEAYTSYSALLIVREMRNLQNDLLRLIFVEKVRSLFGVSLLVGDFTKHSPVYFIVFKAR